MEARSDIPETTADQSKSIISLMKEDYDVSKRKTECIDLAVQTSEIIASTGLGTVVGYDSGFTMNVRFPYLMIHSSSVPLRYRLLMTLSDAYNMLQESIHEKVIIPQARFLGMNTQFLGSYDPDVKNSSDIVKAFWEAFYDAAQRFRSDVHTTSGLLVKHIPQLSEFTGKLPDDVKRLDNSFVSQVYPNIIKCREASDHMRTLLANPADEKANKYFQKRIAIG